MKLNIDFCVIENPIGDPDDNLIIFVTKSGLDDLDKNTRDDVSFSGLTGVLREVGYTETENYKFEYTDTASVIDPNDLIRNIENSGAKYSKGLENTINKEISLIRNKAEQDYINSLVGQVDGEDYPDITSIESAFNDLNNIIPNYEENHEESTDKCDLPNVGETIELNMYLFVDLFLFGDMDFTADISGSFAKNLEGNSPEMYKNLVKILTSQFKRVDSSKYEEVEGIVELESVLTKEEMFKDIGLLFDVSIKIIKARRINERQTMLETDDYKFNIVELKERMLLDEKICFEVEVDEYNDMMNLSDSIKKEIDQLQDSEKIDISDVIEDCEDYIDMLEDRMATHADLEEFTEATKLKDRKKAVLEKLSDFEKSMSDRERISINEFHKLLNTEV